MDSRKIVQVAVIPETEEHYAILIALCDDGTLWRNYVLEDKVWSRISQPPPPEDDED